MNFKLKNGKVVEIVNLDNRSSASDFRKYIMELLKEKPETFIFLNKVPSLKEEKKWLKMEKYEIRKGELVQLVAYDGKKIIGIASARRKMQRDREKAEIGIAIIKNYRRNGLGGKMLDEVIKSAKRKLKTRILYLKTIAENEHALNLYKRAGFIEIARLKKWQKYRGKYQDLVYMKLK